MHGAIAIDEPEIAIAGAMAAPHASLLRFFTCGSVDDGKSTLIGRLLYETGAVFEDQLEALERDSKKFGTQGANLDFALLLDGLSAEREQGITIDVAYRYFSSKNRAFIVADTPGHEQYTRNMATGASTADLAIILIDARKGILPQTRRHSYIVSMLGVRDIVLAVNKMDLVDFDQTIFDRLVADYHAAVAHLNFGSIVAIPLSARDGDNIATRSARAPWYRGPTLLDHLERIEPDQRDESDAGFALPVQWVNRPHLDFRGYAGTIASGSARPGMEIVVLPGARRSTIARIVTADGDRDAAGAGEAVTLTLKDEIDVSRGDVIAAASHGLAPRRSIAARVLWMIDDKLAEGRDYIIQHSTTTANARVATLHHAIDVESFAHKPADALAMNQIGLVTLACDKPLIVTEGRHDRDLGVFILIDRLTNQTAGLGVIEAASTSAPDAVVAPVVAVTPSLGDRWRAVTGERSSSHRRIFVAETIATVVAALILALLAWGLSGSLLAGAAVLIVDLVASAPLRWLARRAAERRAPAADDDINESGAGI